MKHLTLASALLAATTLLSGCLNDTEANPDEIWQLQSINGAPYSASVTLGLSSSSYGGQGPCNRYGGQVLDDPKAGTYRLTTPTSTRMACPNASAEALYFSLLPTVTRAAMTGGSLTLYTSGGTQLRFNRIPG
ncbi:META domain-containing protein [Aliiroseovarius sp.]|uniref:META domain-containing protein n=1 Tax=Aliiroseovarius sp. TaxID=1872442 RepID=UPI003BAADF30